MKRLLVCVLVLASSWVLAQGRRPPFLFPQSAAPAGPAGTITPNDATLVRYVICYESGIPYQVDTTTPYECDAASFDGTTANIWVDGSGTCVDNVTPVAYNSATACATIAAAAATSDAGDRIGVKAGSYSESITESTNGTSGSEITYIAESGVTLTGGFIVTGDYVLIIGFTIDCNSVAGSSGIFIQNADYPEVWNNLIYRCGESGIRSENGAKIYRSDNGIYLGNYISDTYNPTDPHGGTKDFQLNGNSNIVAYTESNNTELDFLYAFGQRFRIQNNYSHSTASGDVFHSDFLQTGGDGNSMGFGQSLTEGNLHIVETGSDLHCVNMEESGNNALDVFHIYRFNVWSTNYLSGNGGQCYGITDVYNDLKIYNETLSFAGLYTEANYNQGGSSPMARKVVQNNIYAPSWWPSTTIQIYDDTPDFHDYSLYFDSRGSVTLPSNVTSESNSKRNVDPLFVDPSASARDFHLQALSPAINAGTALTTTSGSGTGTTFNVATGGGGFFRGSDAANLPQYGGKLAEGDIITVGTDVVQISSISTDAITVTSSFTWANGDAVYLGTDTTPDLGAYPRKTTYTLSATKSGSPSAGFSARVYPRYASKTLWAVAN